MESLLPLRPMEEQFRRFYERTGRHTLEQAITQEEYETWLSEADESFQTLAENPTGASYARRLEETHFFAGREDVTALQHFRYMPAILHSSEFFELECVLIGEIISYSRERRLTLGAGDVLILAPQTSHAACVYDEGGIMVNLLVRRSTFEERFFDLLPESELLRDFFKNALYGTGAGQSLLFRTRDTGFLSRHILPMAEEWKSALRYRNTAMISLLQLFFVELLRSHERDVVISTEQGTVLNEHTIYILEYLQDNVATITLQELAAFFRYSPRQMQRILLAATGLNFGGNKNLIRMRRAAELLKQTDMTVLDIGDLLGYYDASSFRHAFRAWAGMSPQAYRERERGQRMAPVPEQEALKNPSWTESV